MKNSFAQWWRRINAKFLTEIACTLFLSTFFLLVNYLKPSDSLFSIKSKVQNQAIYLKLCHSSGNQLEQIVAFMYMCLCRLRFNRSRCRPRVSNINIFLLFFRLSNFWWIKRTLMAISTMKNSFAQWWMVNAKCFTRNSMHPPLSNFFIRTKLIKAKWSLVLHQIEGPKSIN